MHKVGEPWSERCGSLCVFGPPTAFQSRVRRSFLFSSQEWIARVTTVMTRRNSMSQHNVGTNKESSLQTETDSNHIGQERPYLFKDYPSTVLSRLKLTFTKNALRDYMVNKTPFTSTSLRNCTVSIICTTHDFGSHLITNASSPCACDGGRLDFDGCAKIVNNGRMLAQGDQFSVFDVQVIDAVIDLSVLRARRNIPLYGAQANSAKRLSSVEVDFWLTAGPRVSLLVPTEPREIRVHRFEEEIALGPSCWLWDYLCRSGASGFSLPSSGGADSSSTTALIGIMCQSLVKAVRRHDEQVIADIQRVITIH